MKHTLLLKNVGFGALTFILVAGVLAFAPDLAEKQFTGNAVDTSSSRFSFTDYPYPFVKEGQPNKMFILLPKWFTEEDIRAAELVGKGLEPYVTVEQIGSYRTIAPGTKMRVTSEGTSNNDIYKPSHMNIFDYNSISLGLACHHTLVADALNTPACSGGLQPGEALLYYIPSDVTHQYALRQPHAQLIVTGYDMEALKNAAYVLRYWDNYKYYVTSNKVLITGTFPELSLNNL